MTGPSIPDASYSALFAWGEDRTRVGVEDTIRAIAAPLIAQELRRMRDAVAAIDQSEHSGSLDVGSALQEAGWLLADRADELAPPEVDAADGKPVDQWRPTW